MTQDHEPNTIDRLIAALSESPPTFCSAALLAVLTERLRQDQKWGVQHHTPERWLAILGEEFGELSEAVCETIFDNGLAARQCGGYENMRREAIHVAAVAVALWECLSRDEAASMTHRRQNAGRQHLAR